MDLFKSYYDNKTKDYQVTVSRDDKHIFVCLRHKANQARFIILKRFNSELDYERFLTEAFFLRCSAKMKAVKDVRQVVKNTISFLEDNSVNFELPNNFSL